MFKKVMCFVMCASILAAGIPAAASADSEKISVSAGIMAGAAEAEKEGLVKEDGVYHYYENGKLVKKSWKTVNGKKYYFKKDGSAATLKFKIDGKYYIFDNKGQLFQPSAKKIVKVETGKGKYQKYYVKPNGTAASGWAENKTYYFYENGEMATGIIVVKENFYALKDSGKLNATKTKKLKAATKYAKSKIADLQKLIGKPLKTKYYGGSCYGAGKDGVWTYKNFQVFTFKPTDKKKPEIYMGAE